MLTRALVLVAVALAGFPALAQAQPTEPQPAAPVLQPGRPLPIRPPPARVPQPDGNWFVNASFEDGPDPWWSFAAENPLAWSHFSVTDERARSGRASALLDMDSARYNDPSVRIYGVIQEVASITTPEKLSGWYRVEGWERGTRKQYIQVVVIVWNARQLPAGQRGVGNYQIAYVLGGVDTPPLTITNRKFIMAHPERNLLTPDDGEPLQDEWVFFEFNLREDFVKHWGIEPRDFESLRILFEVRYDDRKADEPRARARVYYDDLYLGPDSRREHAERWKAEQAAED
ncbi:MAG: hypothetical protein KIS87_03765 [Phycisphaeraceae bacterium]|nr:hypothetical protein [Phycisphaeraceae bacterium]